MVSFGRIICVALPFLFTLVSLITLLVAGLAGVSGNKNDRLFVIRVNLTNLQIPASKLQGLVNPRSAIPDDTLKNLGNSISTASGDVAAKIDQLAKELGTSGSAKAKELGNTLQQMAKDSGKSVEDIAKEVARKSGKSADALIAQAKAAVGLNAASGNITGQMIGLHKVYDIKLFNLCYQPQSGDAGCLEPKFNWAKDEISTTMTKVKSLAATAAAISGNNITIPREVTDGLNVFAEAIRWAEIIFIIATISLGIALILGIVANFSRAVSCLTWIVQGVATAFVFAFAGLSTALPVVVDGVVEATAQVYGASADFSTPSLTTIWVSAFFSLCASVFWLATVCCCKPDERRRSKRQSDSEKFVGSNSTSYAPVQGSNGGYYNNANTFGAPKQPQGGRSDMAYEPYSHAR